MNDPRPEELSRVYAQRFDADGLAAGEEIRLGDLTGRYQYVPAAAMTTDGRFLIGWQSIQRTTDPASSIACQLFGASGEAAGPAFQPHSNSEHHRVLVAPAVDGEGNFVTAWGRGDPESDVWNIHARLFDDAAGPSSAEFRVNVHEAGGQPWVNAAMAPDGRFVLVWHSEEQDGDDLGVFAQRFDAAGNPLGALPW